MLFLAYLHCLYIVHCVHAVLQKKLLTLQLATVISIVPLLKVYGMSRVVEFLVVKLPRKKNKLAS